MTADLHLLALQYALGELPEADAVAFERCLESDQAIREALADAVILASAVRQLPAPEPVKVDPPVTRRSRIAALVSCVAASVLFLVVIRLPDSGPTFVQHEIDTEHTTLVGAWSELGDPLLLSEFEGELLADDESEIPDWMVAAVLEEAEAAPRQEGTL